MPITQAEAQAATLAFTRDYPGALELIYHFRESTGELYGHRAAEVPAESPQILVRPGQRRHDQRRLRGVVQPEAAAAGAAVGRG